MPTYDYECEKCGRFEMMQKITAPPLETCPNCGSPVRKLVSKNVAIIFKGSGFYTTDNRQKDYARKLNKERQSESEALADGDIESFLAESDKTDAKLAEGL
ncbi:MAG: transcriptional regulator [Syntrophomonadaceae bacterium]|nr:transcriptional regulator [Syntrophomonadaceae bacterium]